MADRRMFAKSIVNSAHFLRLPPSARLLYYELGMNADDDGAVEAFVVMRMTGASDKDLLMLEEKGFVLFLDREDSVVAVTDWLTNNYIRKDRYKASIYQAELIKAGLPLVDHRETEERVGQYSVREDKTGERQDIGKGSTGFLEGGSGETSLPYRPLDNNEFEQRRETNIQMVNSYKMRGVI